MVAFLAGQIESLGKQIAASPRGRESAKWRTHLEEAVSLAMDYFDRLRHEVERAMPDGQWQIDIARTFVPRYQAWLAIAGETLAFLREAKSHRVTADSAGDFMRAYLEADAIANHFEQDIESIRRIERGERFVGRDAQEQLDELLGHHSADGR